VVGFNPFKDRQNNNDQSVVLETKALTKSV
jgi:hypothetical protein